MNLQDAPATFFVTRVDHTRDGVMQVSPGDWVIRESHPTGDRRFYPCKPDIFAATYEPAPPPPKEATP